MVWTPKRATGCAIARSFGFGMAWRGTGTPLRVRLAPEKGSHAMSEMLAEVLRDLLARGFELPFRFAVIAINGTSMLGSYEPRDDGSVEASIAYSSEDPLRLPINMMFVDACGDAVRVVLSNDGAIRVFDTTEVN